MFLRKQKAAHLIIQVQFKHPERPRGYLSHFTAVIDHSDLFFNDLIFAGGTNGADRRKPGLHSSDRI